MSRKNEFVAEYKKITASTPSVPKDESRAGEELFNEFIKANPMGFVLKDLFEKFKQRKIRDGLIRKNFADWLVLNAHKLSFQFGTIKIN